DKPFHLPYYDGKRLSVTDISKVSRDDGRLSPASRAHVFHPAEYFDREETRLRHPARGRSAQQREDQAEQRHALRGPHSIAGSGVDRARRQRRAADQRQATQSLPADTNRTRRAGSGNRTIERARPDRPPASTRGDLMHALYRTLIVFYRRKTGRA